LGISPQRVYFSIIKTHKQEPKEKSGYICAAGNSSTYMPAFSYLFLIFESTRPRSRINTMTTPTNTVVWFDMYRYEGSQPVSISSPA